MNKNLFHFKPNPSITGGHLISSHEHLNDIFLSYINIVSFCTNPEQTEFALQANYSLWIDCSFLDKMSPNLFTVPFFPFFRTQFNKINYYPVTNHNYCICSGSLISTYTSLCLFESLALQLQKFNTNCPQLVLPLWSDVLSALPLALIEHRIYFETILEKLRKHLFVTACWISSKRTDWCRSIFPQSPRISKQPMG